MDEDRDKKALRHFGRRLEKIRLAKKISYRKLSYSADLSVSYLQKLETGNSNPSYLTLLRLTEALGVDLKEFDFRR